MNITNRKFKKNGNTDKFMKLFVERNNIKIVKFLAKYQSFELHCNCNKHR